MVAAVFLATFIAWASRQREDLVAPNYYADEIRYQQRLDQMNRTQKLEAEVSIKFDSAQGDIVLELPGAHARETTGRISLYRPSDASLDNSLPLEVNADGIQHIDARPLRSGLWKVRVEWAAGGEPFFIERSVIIPGHSPRS